MAFWLCGGGGMIKKYITALGKLAYYPVEAIRAQDVLFFDDMLYMAMRNNYRSPFMEACQKDGDILYKKYAAEERRGEGCGKLLLEWTAERMWGRVVEAHIPVFYRVWDILNEHGNVEYKNRYTYGDIDVSVWIEPSKDYKIVASTRHCSFADDNTHLFIMDNKEYSLFGEFRCRTVWPSKVAGKGWNDGRDIKVPSLQTYRDRDFKYSYGDCRDKGYVFTYSNFPKGEPKVERPTMHEMEHAIWTLNLNAETLEDYEANECR